MTSGEALDIFSVRPATAGRPDRRGAHRGHPPRPARTCWRDGSRSSRWSPRGRPRRCSLFARSRPEVPPTEVKVDNEISRDFTVIDVFTEDRPGVLYTIARVLHEQGLDIHRSKVGVEADRVADIFYVRSERRPTARSSIPARIAAIREALIARCRAAARRPAPPRYNRPMLAPRRPGALGLASCLPPCRSRPPAPGGGRAAAQLERGQRLFESGDLAGALAAFDAAVKSDPKDPRAHYLRGVALEKKGDAAGAEAAYRRAVEHGPSWPRRATTWAGCCWPGATPPAPSASSRRRRGRTRNTPTPTSTWACSTTRAGATPRRWRAYRQAARLKPAEVSYRLNLGAALRRSGDLEGALAEVRRATELAPTQAPAWANLGLLLSDKKDLDGARDGAGQGHQARSDLRRGLGRPRPGGAAAQAAGGGGGGAGPRPQAGAQEPDLRRRPVQGGGRSRPGRRRRRARLPGGPGAGRRATRSPATCSARPWSRAANARPPRPSSTASWPCPRVKEDGEGGGPGVLATCRSGAKRRRRDGRSGSSAQLGEHEGVDEGGLAQPLVAARLAAVTGGVEVHPQQQRVAVGLHRPQLGHPLGRLEVHHLAVVVGRLDQQGGVGPGA